MRTSAHCVCPGACNAANEKLTRRRSLRVCSQTKKRCDHSLIICSLLFTSNFYIKLMYQNVFPESYCSSNFEKEELVVTYWNMNALLSQLLRVKGNVRFSYLTWMFISWIRFHYLCTGRILRKSSTRYQYDHAMTISKLFDSVTVMAVLKLLSLKSHFAQSTILFFVDPGSSDAHRIFET